MQSLVVLPLLLLLTCRCDAKPMSKGVGPMPSFGVLGVDNQIIGGTNAVAGHWKWQLSLQRQGTGGNWAHFCGAALLSGTKGLTAAHCVEGLSASILRVVAGLWARSNETGTQISNVANYVMHERYQVDSATYSNDIAILHFVTPITSGGNIAFATLPANNLDNFSGDTCTITGWGRTSSNFLMPDILQQADIGVITTQDCATRMAPVAGSVIWDYHICLYDTAQQTGSCNGDSGGPCNCPDGAGGYYVAGVTSWGVSSDQVCLPTYPSIYTRTSAYIVWIASN